MKISSLQEARYEYKPKRPAVLNQTPSKIGIQFGKETQSVANQEELREVFKNTYGKPTVQFVKGKNPKAGEKLRVGVILSGGQAPGGHNVIAGLYDGIKAGNPESKLFGFLGGPSGLIDGKYVEIKDKFMDEYRNTGGFDMIGSGRTKIETSEQYAASINTAKKMKLDAVVIIGGDDSNTNAALLAERFIVAGMDTKVIGVPKTIDGDLKNEMIETSFGFDTATKTYSELIGNIERDANSAKKYWHFIKLMGRSASHIALECALQTQPNYTLISEEVEARKLTLKEIAKDIAEVVAKRSENGEDFGVALIPEGLVEFVPEMKSLIAELNDTIADEENKKKFNTLKSYAEKESWLKEKLKASSFKTLQSLPVAIADQLLAERDPHGNVQVSKIETEKLLITMVSDILDSMKKSGTYKGKFSANSHFFGYEGRCAFPSNFDADYCYALGLTAFALVNAGLTGYLSSVRNLTAPAKDWVVGGVPLTMMMNMEQRNGAMKPVIRKALVELDGKPFKAFSKKREEWKYKTSYTFPGAIQYYGPDSVCNMPTQTLLNEQAGAAAKFAKAAEKTTGKVSSAAADSAKGTSKRSTKDTAKGAGKGAAKSGTTASKTVSGEKKAGRTSRKK